ncbi:MAG: hypothetical protein K0Q74_95 [Gammaproteobacteria bacterium]|jgi:hypothetical protein|nr:hypothetical protein [Gammaproteobacteria bacterium]
MRGFLQRGERSLPLDGPGYLARHQKSLTWHVHQIQAKNRRQTAKPPAAGHKAVDSTSFMG